jgi:hypothetical protein
MKEDAIENILKSDHVVRKIFLGVFARDELPQKVKYPSCFVLNNRPRSHSGEHWLAIYYNKDKTAMFFDSYGQEPKEYKLESFMNKTSPDWLYNKTRIQGFSQYCGLYCITFLLLAARNKHDMFFEYFDDNFIKNDEKLDYFLEKY